MSKVYGYCRTAQACHQAIAEQMALIDIYCKQHGLNVDKYFCDNGVSGLILNREELNRLFDVLQRGDVIVVKDISRLSRSIYECVTLVELIEKMGVTLLLIK
jgi:DNA invertase Pin-like site-specific DNA recombinase